MAADETKAVAFLPISKITLVEPASQQAVTDQSSQQKSVEESKQQSSADADMCSTPNSFNKRDLVQKLTDFSEKEIYYLVYTRSKTPSELAANQNVSTRDELVTVLCSLGVG